ncbi:uncharacterized protein LOC121479734 [Vulpes lagopus]|uniref:uncharacterized protein LOC121479734 n=1 Tax=Vulpes lagopus TaxID=494514 RepID=UPI001BC95CFA|nr:uncharacterized protein LOC121479734 [Vulpes lagopus]
MCISHTQWPSGAPWHPSRCFCLLPSAEGRPPSSKIGMPLERRLLGAPPASWWRSRPLLAAWVVRMDRQALRDGGTSLQVAPKGLAWATSLGTGTTLEGGECAGETRRGASLQEEEIGAGKRGWEPCVPQRPRRAEPPGETERSSRLPLLWLRELRNTPSFSGWALPPASPSPPAHMFAQLGQAVSFPTAPSRPSPPLPFSAFGLVSEPPSCWGVAGARSGILTAARQLEQPHLFHALTVVPGGDVTRGRGAGKSWATGAHAGRGGSVRGLAWPGARWGGRALHRPTWVSRAADGGGSGALRAVETLLPASSPPPLLLLVTVASTRGHSCRTRCPHPSL